MKEIKLYNKLDGFLLSRAVQLHFLQNEYELCLC